jgi:AraC-like DNA-binding protein
MAHAVFQPFPMLTGRRAQVWRHQPDFRRPRHFHPEPELNVVVRGKALMGLGGSVTRLERGAVLLFHPGQDHVLLEASEDLELFVFALRPELAAGACGSLSRVASSGCTLSDSALLALTRALEAYGSVADSNAVELGLSALFNELLGELANNHVLSRRALQAMDENPEATGALLARRLGVDQSALSRHFHADLNLTFVEYRARLRTMAFIRLVDEGQTITRAALEAGFGSYAQSHRVLSKALGCAPRRYFTGERLRLDEACYEGRSAWPAATSHESLTRTW